MSFKKSGALPAGDDSAGQPFGLKLQKSSANSKTRESEDWVPIMIPCLGRC